MRVIATATLAMFLTLLPSRVFAQSWNVDLDEITNDDRTVDRIRAESVEFMPDGKTLATAGHFFDGRRQMAVGEVRLLNTLDGSLTATLRGTAVTYSLRAGALACSPSGQRIAAAGRNVKEQYIVDVFDVTGMKHTQTLKGDPSQPTCLVFSPSGKVLAVAHLNGTIDLWDPNTGKKTATFVSHADGVWPIAFSPDGMLLAIGNCDGSVSFRDAQGRKELGRIPAQPALGVLGSVAFSPDGALLAIGGFPNREGHSPIYVWTLQITKNDDQTVTPKQLARLEGHREHTYSLAFSPDGRLLASANQDTTVRIWDVRMTNHFRPITRHNDFVYDVAFSPNGAALATLGRDSLKLWTIKELRTAQ